MNVCACMGPMYGEPQCYCQMVAGGLPLNEEARSVAEARFQKQLAALFAPGGIWHRPRLPAPPANARILVSRNKREGGYVGWRKLGPSQRFPDWDNKIHGHQRLGGEIMWSTLRQRSRS